MEIMLQDGSLAQLLATQVVMRGQTLPIPSDLSNAQSVTVGGQTIQAQPGQSKKPDTSSSDGGDLEGGGLFGFLGKVGGAAGSAAKDISNVASGAASFASGAVGGAGVAALAGTFSGTANSANGVVSTLNGIQQSFPADGLSKSAMDIFNKAQNAGCSSANWMQSMGAMLQGFGSLKPDVQQQVRSNIADYAKPGGQLEQASSALKALEDFPWEQEAPKTDTPKSDISTPTATPKASESARASQSAPTQTSKAETTESTGTSSASSSSSSATPAATGQTLPYYIATEWGTPLETFKNFIRDLDGGVGKVESEETDKKMDYQTYRTQLNSSQAEGLKEKNPFLMLAYADVTDPKDFDYAGEEEWRALPSHPPHHMGSTEIPEEWF